MSSDTTARRVLYGLVSSIPVTLLILWVAHEAKTGQPEATPTGVQVDISPPIPSPLVRPGASSDDHGYSEVGSYGYAEAGDYGTAKAGYRGMATAGAGGKAVAGNWGKAIAGVGGTACAGFMGAVYIESKRNGKPITVVGYADPSYPQAIKPDVLYRAVGDTLVEVKE